MNAQQSNGLATAGFVCSLVGVVGCCVQPASLVGLVGLILSLIAVRREPRGLAIAGIILGLIASSGLILGFLLFGSMLLAFGVILAAVGLDEFAAYVEMAQVQSAIVSYQSEHNAAPADLAALNLDSALETDPWGNAYNFEVSSEGDVDVWSSGPDGQSGTADDVRIDR